MPSPIVTLAEQQLSAYNAADLDAFCECYHPDIRMMKGEDIVCEGIVSFRQRYADKFARGGFGATVPSRVHSGPHCVDEEHWWVDNPETHERTGGVLLVRYCERDGRIGLVQFLN
jgi:hypothetical protein